MLNLIKKYQFLFEELVSRDFKKHFGVTPSSVFRK